MIIKKDPIELLERQELVQKLVDAGYGGLMDILLSNDKKVYTKKGRLNKSGACRVLGWKAKTLEDALFACREILKTELSE
jgi:hypothetical protein